MKRCSCPILIVLVDLYLKYQCRYWNPCSPFWGQTGIWIYQGGHWLPLGYCHAVVFAARSLHVLLSFLHFILEKKPSPFLPFFFCLLFHIKWELCLFRLPLQLNTHIIQARDKMEEHFFFQVHLASNLSNKLFYHIILTLDRRAY